MNPQGTFSFKGVDMEAGDIVSLRRKGLRKIEVTLEAAVMGMNEEGHLLIFNQSAFPFVTNGRFALSPEENKATIQVTCPLKKQFLAIRRASSHMETG